MTTNVVLRMLVPGAHSRDVQGDAYREFFGRAPTHVRAFKRGSIEDPRILGDPQFVEDTWRITGRPSPDRARRARRLEGNIPGVVARVIEQFNALCDKQLPARQAAAGRRIVTYENVRSRSRRRPLPMVRALSVSYLIEHKIATPSQAARFFSCGPRPVSAGRRRFYALLFRKWFGGAPKMLLCPPSGTDRNVGGEHRGHEERS